MRLTSLLRTTLVCLCTLLFSRSALAETCENWLFRRFDINIYDGVWIGEGQGEFLAGISRQVPWQLNIRGTTWSIMQTLNPPFTNTPYKKTLVATNGASKINVHLEFTCEPSQDVDSMRVLYWIDGAIKVGSPSSRAHMYFCKASDSGEKQEDCATP